MLLEISELFRGRARGEMKKSSFVSTGQARLQVDVATFDVFWGE